MPLIPIVLELFAMFATGTSAYFGYKAVKAEKQLKAQGIDTGGETTIFGVDLEKVAKISIGVIVALGALKIINLIANLSKR